MKKRFFPRCTMCESRGTKCSLTTDLFSFPCTACVERKEKAKAKPYSGKNAERKKKWQEDFTCECIVGCPRGVSKKGKVTSLTTGGDIVTCYHGDERVFVNTTGFVPSQTVGLIPFRFLRTENYNIYKVEISTRVPYGNYTIDKVTFVVTPPEELCESESAAKRKRGKTDSSFHSTSVPYYAANDVQDPTHQLRKKVERELSISALAQPLSRAWRSVKCAFLTTSSYIARSVCTTADQAFFEGIRNHCLRKGLLPLSYDEIQRTKEYFLLHRASPNTQAMILDCCQHYNDRIVWSTLGITSVQLPSNLLLDLKGILSAGDDFRGGPISMRKAYTIRAGNAQFICEKIQIMGVWWTVHLDGRRAALISCEQVVGPIIKDKGLNQLSKDIASSCSPLQSLKDWEQQELTSFIRSLPIQEGQIFAVMDLISYKVIRTNSDEREWWRDEIPPKIVSLQASNDFKTMYTFLRYPELVYGYKMPDMRLFRSDGISSVTYVNVRAFCPKGDFFSPSRVVVYVHDRPEL